MIVAFKYRTRKISISKNFAQIDRETREQDSLTISDGPLNAIYGSRLSLHFGAIQTIISWHYDILSHC